MIVNLPYGISFDLITVAAPLAVFRPLMTAIIWIAILLSCVRMLTRLLGLGVSIAERADSAGGDS